jgi:3-methylcrotonyl-CoA carboxylase alpha subunit
VERTEDFASALASCQREAKASFGDDHVLVERYVTRPRHIEIQVFCDSLGGAVYLFERDCSVQRRHQKVLEEAPAPGMTPERRAEMGAAAVAAAQAVGYVGAGTVEFIAEQDGRFYFMEMNTRLQVEHPVTEAITGQDLVEWQLRVAAGQPLQLRQQQLRMRGHAIEARICAENPDANFLPATGTLQVARWPVHVAFQADDVQPRVDTGFVEGDAISPWYDSMIAKLIVWGEDRAQALARLDAALRDTHLVGLHTNVGFLRRVVGSRSFAQADLDTALIEREREVLFNVPGLPLRWALAGVVAHLLANEADGQGADPWSRTDGWRMHGLSRRRLHVEQGGQRHEVLLERTHDGMPVLELQGERMALDVRALGERRHDVTMAGHRQNLTVHAVGRRFSIFGATGHAVLDLLVAGGASGDTAAAGGLSAPMPGKLISLLVNPGQAVRQGQALAVMEAMKMEHTISAPRDGVVAQWLHGVGDQVAEGAELLKMEVAA